MGLPQLFGSDYGMIAVIAVVLLLALLGLMMLRGRQKKRSAGETPVGQPGKLSRAEKAAMKAAAKPVTSTSESRKASALAAMHERDATEAADMIAQNPDGVGGEGAGLVGATAEEAALPVIPGATAAEAAAPGPGVPPAQATRRGDLSGGRKDRQKPVREVQIDTNPAAALESDPLERVLASILQGWGDLTTEDTNRLDVFRRDRVMAAIAKVELPKEGKGTEYAKTRLVQLRRYAAFIEQGERPAPPAIEVQEFAGMSFGPSPAAASVGTAGAGAAPGVAAAGAAAAAPRSANPPGRRSWYAAEPDRDSPAPQESDVVAARKTPEPREWRTTPTGEDTDEMETAAAEERAAEFNWGASTDDLALVQSQLKAVDLTWNREPADVITPSAPLTTPEPPPAPFEPPIAPAPPATAAPAESWGSGGEASRSAEAAVAAAAAAFWGTPDEPRPEQPLGGYGKTVSKAADIMDLPVDERPDMLAFLEPGELTKVYQMAGDKNLKKTVIDTLEHIGNTASLDAIHFCLEDQDPEIQLYALDAAERMLGKNS